MQISNIKTQFNTILIKKTVRSFSAVIEWISLNCQMRRKSDGCSVRTCYLLMHSCQLSLWSFFLQMPVDGGWFTWPREHIAFIHALCKHWHHTVHSWYFSAPCISRVCVSSETEAGPQTLGSQQAAPSGRNLAGESIETIWASKALQDRRGTRCTNC